MTNIKKEIRKQIEAGVDIARAAGVNIPKTPIIITVRLDVCCNNCGVRHFSATGYCEFCGSANIRKGSS